MRRIFGAATFCLHYSIINCVKAWHRAIQSLGVVHPTIWKLIRGLAQAQKLRETEMEQLVAWIQPPPKRALYVRIDERISRIVNHNRVTLDYLRGVALNFGL